MHHATELDHVIISIYPEATILEKVLTDGSHIAHPISPADLAAQLNQIPLSTGLLPPNTLFWRQAGGMECIAIYVPPRRWQPIAYERHYALPMPGMVFIGFGTQYTVFAVKRKPKSADAILYHLPVPNVNENGRICRGSVPFPTAGRDTIGAALDLFMEGSEFNHDNSQNRCHSFPENTLALWQQLDGKRKFPHAELVSARQRLGQLMS